MRVATIQELKWEMGNMDAKELLELCSRLARFKKENKELLTFLLFESHDIDGYTVSVKLFITEQFNVANKSNVYLAKKSVRKILRSVNKFIRYAASPMLEVELLIHFCASFKLNKIPVNKSIALFNLYEGQVKKIIKTILLLHEDLQYDYMKRINGLME